MEIATQQAPSVPVLLTALVGARFRSVRNEEREANLILRAESALDEHDDRARAWEFFVLRCRISLQSVFFIARAICRGTYMRVHDRWLKSALPKAEARVTATRPYNISAYFLFPLFPFLPFAPRSLKWDAGAKDGEWGQRDV